MRCRIKSYRKNDLRDTKCTCAAVTVYREPKRTRTEFASTNDYNNSAFDGATGTNTWGSGNTPVVGAVAGDDNDDYEPARYEAISDNQGCSPEVAPSYDMLRPNRQRIHNNFRNSLMPR